MIYQLEDLIIFTWKLREHSQKKFEEIAKTTINSFVLVEKRTESKIESVFILKTCERILFAFMNPFKDQSVFSYEYYHLFMIDFLIPRITNNNLKKIFVSPQILTGVKAFKHLCLVSSSLDSTVLGETQVLGQFKEAYNTQKNSGNLKGSLEELVRFALRAGKRVFRYSDLPKGKVSIFSNVSTLIDDWRVKQNINYPIKIAIIGTGDMGEEILGYFINKPIYFIKIYSRSREKMNSTLNLLNVPIRSFKSSLNDIFVADMLILCSSSDKPYLTPKIIEENKIKIFQKTKLIFDLGMPSNCEKSLNNLTWIKLYQMEDLIAYSNQNYQNREKYLPLASKIISQEIIFVNQLMAKKLITPQIKQLRSKLESISLKRLNELDPVIVQSPKFQYWYRRTIREIMHVSQSYLEDKHGIIGMDSSHDTQENFGEILKDENQDFKTRFYSTKNRMKLRES